MARGLFRWNGKKLVKIKQKKKSWHHYVIGDTLNEAEDSLTGSGFKSESKSRLKQERKNAGIEVTTRNSFNRKSVHIETEEDRIREIKDDAERAYMDIKYDKVPRSENEIEIDKREQRAWIQYKKNNYSH